jgi:hypothetical protein
MARHGHPATSGGVEHGGRSPENRKHEVTEPKANVIGYEPANRLHQGVGKLKRSDNIGIVRSGEMKRIFELRGENSQSITINIVHGGTQCKQSKYPPSESDDFPHVLCLRGDMVGVIV